MEDTLYYDIKIEDMTFGFDGYFDKDEQEYMKSLSYDFIMYDTTEEDQEDVIGKIRVYEFKQSQYDIVSSDDIFMMFDEISQSTSETTEAFLNKDEVELDDYSSVVVVDLIEIEKKYRGKGLGTALVNYFKDYIFSTNEAPIIALKACPLSKEYSDTYYKEVLRPFYKGLGFRTLTKTRENGVVTSAIMYLTKRDYNNVR